MPAEDFLPVRPRRCSRHLFEHPDAALRICVARGRGYLVHLLLDIFQQLFGFFDAVLYINDRVLWPLQTLLREVLLPISMSELLGSGGNLSDVMPPSSALINATIIISCLPIILVYPFIQKYFVKGIMVGSVKG